jgi:hypothetical protein
VRRHRIRRTLAWFFIVVAVILVPLSVVAAWAVTTITNTDRYVATLAPLAREHVVTDYVAVRATNKLFTEVNVQAKLEHALPKRAAPIAAPVTDVLHNFVQEQLTKVLRSERFQQFWDKTNRTTHQTFVNFLTGQGNPKLQKAESFAVDVSPQVVKAIDKLDQKGIHYFDGVKAKAQKVKSFKVPLATKQQVSKIRTLFRYLVKVGWALGLLTLLLMAIAVALAVDRRKALLRLALGSVLAVLFFLAALALGRWFFVDQNQVSPLVTGTVFDTMVRYLRTSLRVVLGISAGVAVILWLIGPARWAVAIRRGVARAFRWVGRRIAEFNQPERRQQISASTASGARWVTEHCKGLRIVGVVVAGVVLIFGGNLSPGGLLWTAIGLLIYLGLLQLVVAWARRVGPGPTGPGAPTEAAGAKADPDPAPERPADPAPTGGGGRAPV